MPDAGSSGLMIAMVATGAGMVGPVLSYVLLERQADAPGALLGRRAAAGNLAQALGSMRADSLFPVAPMASFWAAAAILLPGAVLAMVCRGPTRIREIAAGRLVPAGDGTTAAVTAAERHAAQG